MDSFSKAYSFQNMTSNPQYPQSKGRWNRQYEQYEQWRISLRRQMICTLPCLCIALHPYNGVIGALLSCVWEGSWEQTYLRYMYQAHSSLTGSLKYLCWTYLGQYGHRYFRLRNLKYLWYGEADKLYKERLKKNFDHRHRVATLLQEYLMLLLCWFSLVKAKF